MLPLLIGLLVAGGPLLRGSWDLWAQSLLFLAVTAGAALWLIARALIGYVPLPSRRNMAWAAGLAFWAGLSAFLSPVACYAVPAWRVLLLGLWIFPAITTVSKDERSLIDEAIRASGWILVLLAFYQRFHDGIGRPASAFLNTNVFAGAVLLLLPLAAQKRDWLLGAGLLMALWWSHSVGAWLGLAGALMLTRRSTGIAAYWLGAALAFGCLVAIYAKLHSPDVLHRGQWWMAAARMAAARPWLGFGPGSFAYAVSAYLDPARPLATLYAHEHPLELAAECGLPYLLAWGFGLAHLLSRGGSHKRFGALAILIQSLWDYSLSIPSNFWLFCYFAASSDSQAPRGLNVPASRKLPACLLIAAAAWGLCFWAGRRWEADRLKARAEESLSERAPGRPARALLARSAELADDPETERLAAGLELLGAPAPASLRAAAAHLEKAAALNPYRASNWAGLARIYGALGQSETARLRLRQGAVFCPILR